MCNPTGRPRSFRAVDWLVEFNNLYTKVIYCGKNSNQSKKAIVKNSPLISIYRNCHSNIEENYHLVNRTTNHHPASIPRSLKRLRKYIEDGKPHTFTAGRSAHPVTDHLANGIQIFLTRKGMEFVDGDDPEDAPERSVINDDDIF